MNQQRQLTPHQATFGVIDDGGRRVGDPTTNRQAGSLPIPSDMEKILTQELYELSLEEREQSLEEIHGVHGLSVARKEENISLFLRQMHIDLENLPSDNVYNLGIRSGSQYINQSTNSQNPQNNNFR